jgi:hypothetical protein
MMFMLIGDELACEAKSVTHDGCGFEASLAVNDFGGFNLSLFQAASTRVSSEICILIFITLFLLIRNIRTHFIIHI